MSATTYEYAKLVNGPKLLHEVLHSGITVALETVNTVGTSSFLTFKTALSQGEKTELDELVEDHDPSQSSDQVVSLTSIVENQNCEHLDLTYKMKAFLYDIPNSAGPHTFDISFPYDIMLLGGVIEPAENMVGDSVKFETLSDTVVGQLSEDSVEGNSFVKVNIEAAENYIWRGYELDAVTLDQNGQIVTSTPLGECISKAGQRINLAEALTEQQEFAAGTYVSVEYTAVGKMQLMNGNTVWISRDTDRGALIPAGTKMKFYYYNDTSGAKKAQIVLEYYT